MAVYGAGEVGRLVDDPSETLLDPEQARDQVTDSLFGADETAYLHLDDTTRSSNGIVARLIDLVPANFRDAPDAAERRTRFTTVSADLKSYSVSPERLFPWEVEAVVPAFPSAPTFPPRNADPGPAPWETFGGGQPWPAGHQRRAGMPAPAEPLRMELRGLLGSKPNSLTGAPNEDAGRGELKQLTRKLSVNHVAAARVGGDGRPRYILRPVTPHPGVDPNTQLPLLGLAPVTGPPGVTRFGVSDHELFTLEFVDKLMDDGFLTSSIRSIDHDGNPATPLVPVAAQQEWHARRDRQNLARDIYTLLYTFGKADSTTALNPVTTPNVGGIVYSDDVLREMAQFAVNLVDAMDTDDTITTFVYDKNLAGGWTTDDDGYSNPPPYNPPPLDTYEDPMRGMVFGVEAQKLAISEALALFARKYEPTPPLARNHGATQWDDASHRDFIYVELQNMTPMRVHLNGGWSIVCDVNPGTTSVLPTARSLTIADGSFAPPGHIYTIGTAGDRHIDQDGNPLADSVMRVDWDSGDSASNPPYKQIAPQPGTSLSFDGLIADNSTYRVNDYPLLGNDPSVDGQEVGDPGPFTDPYDPSSGTDPKAGLWLDLGDQSARNNVDDTLTVRFRLRRRLNLNRAVPDQTDADANSAAQQDNRWVEVDFMEVNLKHFNIGGSGPGDVQAQLTNAFSEKRTVVLDRTSGNESVDFRNFAQYQQNTLGGYHADDLTGPQPWQRHFDRQFASPADIMSVPLYGPQNLTEHVTQAGGPAVGDKTSTAAARFLFPDQDPRYFLSPPAPAPQILATGNLWYRLFEFVEVPQKYGDSDGLGWFAHYGGPSPWGASTQENLRLREFGKLNFNTMRHPHALAGLLDDLRVFVPAFQIPAPVGPGPGYMPSAGTNGTTGTNNESWVGMGRDWWLAMLASRDGGYDPYLSLGASQNVILPGVPSAKPFLGFGATPAGSTTADITAAFSRTLLRGMPGTATLGAQEESGQGRRSLFELGNLVPGGITPPSPQMGSDAEFETRYRLLGKALNHGTTRSNTYVAFITCDFYEATNEGDVDGDPNTPDVFSIGAKIPADTATPDDPRYRGVFVIDRSLALEMIKRRDLPPSDPGLVYPRGSQYRTYSFAREAGSDGRPTPTFDWQDLVLFRKIVKAQ